MPGRDTTGPMGGGPLTGRRMGQCTGNNTRGFNRSGGFGMGNGRGFRRYSDDTQRTSDGGFLQMISDLSKQVSSLKDEIRELRNKKDQ